MKKWTDLAPHMIDRVADLLMFRIPDYPYNISIHNRGVGRPEDCTEIALYYLDDVDAEGLCNMAKIWFKKVVPGSIYFYCDRLAMFRVKLDKGEIKKAISVNDECVRSCKLERLNQNHWVNIYTLWRLSLRENHFNPDCVHSVIRACRTNNIKSLYALLFPEMSQLRLVRHRFSSWEDFVEEYSNKITFELVDKITETLRDIYENEIYFLGQDTLRYSVLECLRYFAQMHSWLCDDNSDDEMGLEILSDTQRRDHLNYLKYYLWDEPTQEPIHKLMSSRNYDEDNDNDESNRRNWTGNDGPRDEYTIGWYDDDLRLGLHKVHVDDDKNTRARGVNIPGTYSEGGVPLFNGPEDLYWSDDSDNESDDHDDEDDDDRNDDNDDDHDDDDDEGICVSNPMQCVQAAMKIDEYSLEQGCIPELIEHLRSNSEFRDVTCRPHDGELPIHPLNLFFDEPSYFLQGQRSAKMYYGYPHGLYSHGIKNIKDKAERKKYLAILGNMIKNHPQDLDDVTHKCQCSCDGCHECLNVDDDQSILYHHVIRPQIKQTSVFQHDQFILGNGECGCLCDACQVFCEFYARSEVIRRRENDLKTLGLCPEEFQVQAGLGQFHGPWLPDTESTWRLETEDGTCVARISGQQSYHTGTGEPIDLSYLLQKPLNPEDEDECLTFLKGFSLFFEREEPWDYMIDCDDSDEDNDICLLYTTDAADE